MTILKLVDLGSSLHGFSILGMQICRPKKAKQIGQIDLITLYVGYDNGMVPESGPGYSSKREEGLVNPQIHISL